MTHSEWLENEYSRWVQALKESTVHNFKEHPTVRRMLGEPPVGIWMDLCRNSRPVVLNGDVTNRLIFIDNIGRRKNQKLDGVALRYIYYAQQILALNPSSICEIGGGVGQFYATLRALGWKGDYVILDLPEVQLFQNEYLKEVTNQTGLNTDQEIRLPAEMLVSFYALGEFDNETKRHYENWIDNSKHGYIAFNPHSGASDSLSIFENHDIKVTPGVEPGISIIEW